MAENLIIKDDFIRTFSENGNEPKWLLDFRTAAWQKVAELDLPYVDKTKINRWNFTKFDTFHAFKPGLTGEELDSKVTGVLDLENKEANYYVQVDQHPARLQLQAELKEQGVIFEDLHSAIQNHPELVKSYLMTQAVQKDEHKLTAFHAALINGGVFLYVPKNVEVKAPIQAVFVQKKYRITTYQPQLDHCGRQQFGDLCGKLYYVR